MTSANDHQLRHEGRGYQLTHCEEVLGWLWQGVHSTVSFTWGDGGTNYNLAKKTK